MKTKVTWSALKETAKNSSKFPLGYILSLHKFSENILTSCLYDI